jgi:hypothetical protein
LLAHKQTGQAKIFSCTGTPEQGYLLFLKPTSRQWRQIIVARGPAEMMLALARFSLESGGTKPTEWRWDTPRPTPTAPRCEFWLHHGLRKTPVYSKLARSRALHCPPPAWEGAPSRGVQRASDWPGKSRFLLRIGWKHCFLHG